MAPQPQRREQRKTHLDASVVPMERALLARAADMESASATFRQAASAPPLAGDEAAAQSALARAAVLDVTASEFRALAEELHWW
jgi:hypothetical protein